MGKKKNIFLIGFMGCGKSTVAASMQTRYDMKRLEMDQTIEEEQGKTIPQIFEEDGEPFFRSLETELLKRFSDQRNYIVSCGGGTAMREENVRIMKENGLVIWLTADPATVLKRVQDSSNRPLLEGHKTEEYIQELMEKREPAYRAASDVCISTDGKSAMEIGTEIMKHFR